jgi:nicotinamidase/pyrazinamidase
MMLEGPLVFIDIDTQRDFLESTGALYVTGSEAIVANLGKLTEYARKHDIPIFATTCAHRADDPEFRLFPPHCLVGTQGQENINETAWSGTVYLPESDFPDKPPPHLTIEKSDYDLFSHPGADRLVTLYDRDRPTFVVYGVATDYCVKAAVEGLLDRGCRVAIVVDAIRAIDPKAEERLLTDFARRGALLTLTEVVCGA